MRSTHQKLTFLALLSTSLLLACQTTASASSVKMKILHAFCASHVCSDGESPNPIVADSNGNLFGTTLGGKKSHGVVFELRRQSDSSHQYNVLYNFHQVVDPSGTLVIDLKGNLYGVTRLSSQIFELSPNKIGWTKKTLYTFCTAQPCVDGISPVAGLAYAGQRSGAPYDGKSPLYGTTQAGGAHNGGTVFELLPDKRGWRHQKLYDFCAPATSSSKQCLDGAAPSAQLLVDNSGNLFGTTTYGGTNGADTLSGTVFELSPSEDRWTERVLYSFCSQYACADGAYPNELAMDESGILYGFAQMGGAKCVIPNEWLGCGVAFKIVPNGTHSQETVLHNFCAEAGCRDGLFPGSTPYLDANGNLFAMAVKGGDLKNDWDHTGGGTLFGFSLADPDNTFHVLYRFCRKASCSDGAWPVGFVGNPSGVMYGVTYAGGPNAGGRAGTVFELTQ